jgi:hypothetical protein
MFFKNNINKKTKRLVYVFFLLNILVLVISVFVLYIVYKKYNSVALLEKRVKVTEDRKDKIISTKRLILNTKEDIKNLNSYFVDSDNMVGFIKDIETLGKNAGVSLVLSSVDISDDGNGLLSLKFTTEGDWSGLMYLLSLVESMPVKMVVNNVSFAKQDIKQGKKYWDGKFSITLLSFINK